MSSSSGNACSSSSFPNAYWSQAGFVFTSTGWATALADTQTNCLATIPTITINTNDDLQFTISANSGAWTTEVRNLSQSSNNLYYWIRTGLPSSTMATNNDNTSVFLENKNTNTTWDDQFIVQTLTINEAKIKKTDNSWVNWDAESQFVLKCGVVKPDNVISNTLVGGLAATWNVVTMANSWPACTP